MLDQVLDVILVHGVRVPLGPAISGPVLEHMRRGSFELAEARALWRILRHGDRVLELGAGCGFLSTYCAQRLGSEAVLTVEADPGLEATIRAVYAENGVSPRLLMRAVSRDGHKLRLLRSPDFWATKTATEPSPSPGNFGTWVHGISFGELLSRHEPTVVVVDIEGGELDLCGEHLPASVRELVVETHGPECERAVAAWLCAEGFAVLADGLHAESPDVWTWRRVVARGPGRPVVENA